MVDLTKLVDLHIHTTCSDGDLSVDEILMKAKEKRLKFVGIVDHDTIEQFDKVKESALAKKMKESGVRVWVGTEFSCKINGLKLHLIGYNFDHTSKEIFHLIEKAQKLRQEDLFYKVETARSLGATITDEQLEKLKAIENVGKPHIALCIKENGAEGSIGEIIRKYLDSKKLLRLETKEVIDAVHKAGGIVVIAHPYQIATENHISEGEAEKVWEELVRLKADGMECFYSLYDMEKIKHLVSFANKRGLIITLGSDFHGKTKPNIEIGMVKKGK